MNRNFYKRVSELSAWDLDAGCKTIIDQSTPAHRRLKKKIRKQDRKRLDKYMKYWYNEEK